MIPLFYIKHSMECQYHDYLLGIQAFL